MPSFRIGHGYDIHRTAPGRRLFFGGVEITPTPFGLDGHSDADCLCHALADAILGAAKQMHTVIADECTGCELCIPPCPVDCIVMQDKPVERARGIGERLFRFQGGLRLLRVASAARARAEHARDRFLARESRLQRLSQERESRLSEKKQALRDGAIAKSEPLGRDES